ncbi:MAG: hypothetical protein WCW54_01690 [Candidatus Paceibacterota bacterium]
MKKQTITKIISPLIVSVVLLAFVLPISYLNAATSAGSNASLYSNPNQSSPNNPYRFKVSDVVNPQMLTSVVGCTGVVNKTAKFMTAMVGSPEERAAQIKVQKDAVIKLANNTCVAIKAGIQLIAGTTPVVNNLTDAAKTTAEKVKFCEAYTRTNDPESGYTLAKILEEEKAKKMKDDCFDGIAITLAKNQLTAMARSTMNWVNSGYGGNPLFVQNMRNLTYNIEKNVVETGIDIMLAPKNANPYAADFARSTINSQGIVSSSSRFLGGLQSDLGNFISNPKSYYSDKQLTEAEKTQQALRNAQDANNAFARDFSLGGWNGWLALTQREKNNPLGFNMLANQYLSDMQTQVVSDQKAEIAQNNGFMSQKECIWWYRIDTKTNDWLYQEVGDANEGGGTHQERVQTQNPTDAERKKPNSCAKEKIITPGSLIKDKVGNYLNSPDRQLELVKTINDGLNVLFSALISKLQSGGLTSLSDSAVATSWTDNMNTLKGGTTYDNNGAYDGFNLTRDLGNTYIHSATTNLGTWNANTNKATLSGDAIKVYPKDINITIGLYPSTAPEIYTYNNETKIKELAYPVNPFYTVTVAGKTKLMTDGYNGWEVGDRAFWDGSAWQNWKKGQQSPIAKRGVIQLQQDYIVAAKEVLGVLPKVMTSLGELDYCIPGPNPSYKTNSTDAQSAYQDWVNSIYTGPLNQGDIDRLEWKIDREDSTTYKNLSKIFDNNKNVWKQIADSNAVAWFLNYFGPFTGTKNEGTNSYVWKSGVKFNEAVKLQKFITDYTNSYLFQNFYEVFDKMMNKVYFNNMTREYNDTETSIREIKNPSYVPMAQNGLDFTKDILYYNDQTSQKIQEYTDAVAQAKINIAKLQPIRDEVSGIIKAAQDRRDANLVKILNDEATRTGGKVLTKAQYDAKYASCLQEEDIQVFDADGILGRGSKAEENCNDGIDNDLNGLTDAQDPACPNYVAPSTVPKTNTTNTGNTLERARTR